MLVVRQGEPDCRTAGRWARLLSCHTNSKAGKKTVISGDALRETSSGFQRNFTSRTFQFTTNIRRLLLLASAGYTKNPLLFGL